ncbi:Histidine protein methyltransferase 1 homolog [Linum grandiflorum]
MAFANSEFKLFSAGKGFDESPSFQPAAPRPLPPSVEVLASEVSSTVKCPMEPLEIDDGLTLLKGRVRTQEIMGLPNSDLVPGVYEGGLKLWEGSLDLVKALRSEIRKGELSFSRKKVLELGCGHGLPGIYACLEGAMAVHFQDFNTEVLKCLTIPNATTNLSSTEVNNETEVRYFAGDWSQVHQCLPHVHSGTENSSGESPVYDYDVILMAETIYAVSAQPSLYELVKKCVKRPGGVVYMSAKKYYFGVGGGTRQFLSMVEKDGVMAASLVAEVADGSSNVREVWKLSMKSCPDS